MNDTTIFFAVIIMLFIIFYFVITYIEKKIPERKPVKRPKLITHSLSSGYFIILMIIALIQGSAIFLKMPVLFFFIFIATFVFSHFKSFKKINQNALDERERLLILQAQRNAGFAAIASPILLVIAEGRFPEVKEFITTSNLTILPVWAYFQSYSICGFYYFRKNEKELEMEIEK